jgi:S1-C subfamily serine protease
MNPEVAPTRRRTTAALVVVLAVAAGVVGGHLIWSGSSSVRPNATSNTSNPFRSSLGGGVRGGCTSTGCSFSFGGPGSGAGLPGGSGSGSGGGSSSGSVASSITSKVDPGIVDINTDLGYSGGQAAGTGMVVTASGEVFTNNHVIDGATTITATDLGNGKTYTARVVGYDYGHDIAVLQLEGASGLKTVTLGDSSSLRVGEAVATIGNAGGTGGTPSAATGQISGLSQSITAGDELSGQSEHLSGLVELNGDLQPGDSGGPLVDSAGDVVGMDTAASSTFEFANASGSGFAIPIAEVERIAKEITSGSGGGTIHIGKTGFLGVNIESSSSTSGAVVEAVHSGTPASTTTLAAGDVITKLDGTTVTSPTDLTHLILKHHPGDSIQLTWLTPSGASHTATVTLASGPPQ